MFHLSQMRDRKEAVSFFQDAIGDLFRENFTVVSDLPGEECAYSEAIQASDFSHGYIVANAEPPALTKQLMQNSVQMLAVILDRLLLEEKLSSKAEHYENIAEKRLRKSEAYVKELEKSRRAFLNLIEDLKQEVSDRQRAEQKIKDLNLELELKVEKRTASLAAANRELEAFAYSVSHDLRAPLRAIQGFSEILAERHRDSLDQEGQRYFDHIVDAGRNMSQLIGDLLSYSRLGREAITVQPVDIREVAERVLQLLDERIVDCGGRVVLEGGLPKVLGDAGMVQRVLVNLVENALVYHRPEVPPLVKIYCEQQGETVRILVQDNGIGIDPRFDEKVFEMFQRLHAADAFEGTGIGLALVRKCVRLMDGQCGVISEPDKGATFWVSLQGV